LLKTKGLLEKQALKESKSIVGLDEVGRGCLAGPVYAAAVILDLKQLFKLEESRLNLIRDSKKLSAKQRELSSSIIKDIACSYAVASTSARDIEEYGIVESCFMAMRKALKKLASPFDKVYVDGNKLISKISFSQEAIVKGDNLLYTISAASILAKQSRDKFMEKQASIYPQYAFKDNVGYGTKIHLEALKQHGACSLHRRNFAPIKHM